MTKKKIFIATIIMSVVIPTAIIGKLCSNALKNIDDFEAYKHTAWHILHALTEKVVHPIIHDHSKISTDRKILGAIYDLEDIGANDVLDILNGKNKTKRPIKIMFSDLYMYNLQKVEAVTMKNPNNGSLTIYINKKHEDASGEALACLIAHESQHHTQTNTIDEELRAWMKEISVWALFMAKDHDLANKDEGLEGRQNRIYKLYNEKGVEEVKATIARNPMYKNLS